MKTRKFLRVPLPMAVRVKVADRDGDFVDTRIGDISWGGAFIVLDPPAKMGDRVIVQLILAEENISLELWGTVVRSRGNSQDLTPGVGVEFDALDDDSRSLIQRIINEEIMGLLQSLTGD